MSHHIKGQSRTQSTLFPEALDDLVADENPVRVIDAFVDSVDLALSNNSAPHNNFNE
jgi:transposase